MKAKARILLKVVGAFIGVHLLVHEIPMAVIGIVTYFFIGDN